MKTIFISHSSHDKPFANKLKNKLEFMGINIWFDENKIYPGDQLIQSIKNGIANVDGIIIIVSPNSLNSKWVQEEISLAKAEKKRNPDFKLIPIQLDESKLPPSLMSILFVKFASHSANRSQLFRLAHQIFQLGDIIPLTAKEAILRIKNYYQPQGYLIGVSQQGITQAIFPNYEASLMRDWQFAEFIDGKSRYWVLDYFDPTRKTIKQFSILDGKPHELLSSELSSLQKKERTDVPESGGKNTLRRITSYPHQKRMSFFIDSDEIFNCFRVKVNLDIDTLSRFFFMSKLEYNIYIGIYTWDIMVFEPISSKYLLSFSFDPATGTFLQGLKTKVAVANSRPFNFRFKDNQLSLNMDAMNVFWSKSQYLPSEKDFLNCMEQLYQLADSKNLLRCSIQAEKLYPNLYKLYMYMGLSYVLDKNFEKSIESFNKCINMKPSFAHIYTLRGNSKNMLNDNNGALLDHNYCIELDSNSYLGYFNRSGVKYILGDTIGAIEDLKCSLRINPNYSKATEILQKISN